MKVDIITPNAKMSLDMNAEAASRLIQAATELADGNRQITQAPREGVRKAPGTTKAAEHGSRRARLFGESFKSTSAQPREEAAHIGEKKPFREDERCGGKGFIMNQCQNCGTVRPFFVKNTIKYATCACGARTFLKGLKRASTVCQKCGRSVTYYTNLSKPAHVMKCLDCDGSIELCLTPDGKEYKTVLDIGYVPQKGRSGQRNGGNRENR